MPLDLPPVAAMVRPAASPQMTCDPDITYPTFFKTGDSPGVVIVKVTLSCNRIAAAVGAVVQLHRRSSRFGRWAMVDSTSKFKNETSIVSVRAFYACLKPPKRRVFIPQFKAYISYGAVAPPKVYPHIQKNQGWSPTYSYRC